MSTEDLIEMATIDHGDAEYPAIATNALVALQERGNRDVLDKALMLCSADEPRKRIVGARILGELSGPKLDRGFPEECCDALLGLATRDPNIEVIRSAVIALGHLGNSRCHHVMIELSQHPDATVRRGAAIALHGGTSELVVEALLRLMSDEDDLVRDWATTRIGMTSAIDGAKIRTALLKRAEDADEITRAEAIHGLARRSDQRVLPLLIHELQAENDFPHLFEDAAKSFLGIDPEQILDPATLLHKLLMLSQPPQPS